MTLSEKNKEQKEKAKLRKQFALHLIRLREAKGITSAELARLCYMERSSIARMETAKVNPTLYMIKRLCDGLKIGFDEFFEDFYKL
jgi:transcriptional regulator with XRE-family HTH domain